MNTPAQSPLSIGHINTRSYEQQLRKRDDGPAAVLNKESPPLESPGTLLHEFQDCAWDDVLDSMQIAKNEHDAKAEKSKLRATPRNRAVITTLQSLTDMIPDQDGLSVMRGGLKCIFEMLRQRIANRERILRAFEDIPLTFSTACETFSDHSDDELLRKYVENLYRTLKDEIPKLVEILNRQHKGSLTRRLLKQHPEHEASSIDSCLDNVAKASQRVSRRVEILVGKTVVENLRETRNLGPKIDETREGVRGLYSGLDCIRTQQLQAEERLIDREGRRSEKFNQLVDAIDQKIGNVTSQLRAEVMGFHGHLYRIFEDQMECAFREYGKQRVRGRPALTGTPLPARQFTCDNIFASMGIEDPFFLANDLEEILRRSNDLDRLAMGRANWLLVTPRFETWMQFASRKSDLILIDGHLGAFTVGKISPLSVLTASLENLAKWQPQLLMLFHFCGLHSYLSDKMSGPRGMLRSLIAQLVLQLSQWNQSTIVFPVVEADLLEDISSLNVHELCLLFRGLLEQFPEDTIIYCILDDISEFETTLGGWEGQLCEIVDLLQSMIDDVGSGPTLKVLMTAAHKSVTTIQHIDPCDHISLEAGNMSSKTMQQLTFGKDL